MCDCEFGKFRKTDCFLITVKDSKGCQLRIDFVQDTQLL